MIKFSTRKLLPYTSLQIYNLVLDIDSYPDFLPWCVSAKIVNNNKKEFKADLEIGINLIREKFTSEVVTIYPRKIVSNSIAGPFRVLKNEWNFKEVKYNLCEVQLNIEFEFNSIILQKLIGKIFEKSTKTMIEAFESRAKHLYSVKTI